MGPTAPATLVAQKVSSIQTDPVAGAEADSSGTNGVEAACHGGGGGGGHHQGWTEQLRHHYLGMCNHGLLHKFAMLVIGGWFQDQALTNTVENIITSKLFKIVIFKCGIGPILFWQSLLMVSETWYPGLDTNPAQCDPEITLLPYRWNRCSGFYGDYLSEWGNGRGYHLHSVTPKNDIVELFTSSSLNNIYHNEKPIITLQWNYSFIADPVNNPTGKNKSLFLSLANEYYINRLTLFYAEPRFYKNGDERLEAEEVWSSTANKSGRCKIVTRNGDLLNMDLEFDANGVGGGTVDIRSWSGQVNHYVFVVNGYDHGYYTKNGGKKHHF
ncbi:MAG: hypothetical protein AB1439_02185 [candidate division FCPU426 bacterium]